MISQSTATMLRNAVEMAERVGAPPESVARLLKAERDNLAAELAQRDRAINHLRSLLFTSCNAAGIHRTEDLPGWIATAAARLAPSPQS